ncbi:hypothetical protein OC845_005562 [Tilletia horrida]|nr:hypothetical protein OC845_005562 [Tilletia horrida]
MSVPLHLYPHLRIHQVFGANTDVGKTLFTTALCLAETQFAAQGKQVHYLKPVSTGPATTADARHLRIHAPALSRTSTLIQYPDALSPHLAARKAFPDEPQKIPKDHDVQTGISSWIGETAALSPASYSALAEDVTRRHVLYLETAGGVHSPSPSGSSQATLLRPFRLPTILVGSPHLGGISATISAYESLMLHGFDVDAILLLSEPHGSERWGNSEYLAKWAEERAHHGLRFWSIGGPSRLPGSSSSIWGPPPEKGSNSDEQDFEHMQSWYRGLVNGDPSMEPSSADPTATRGLLDVVKHLEHRHVSRLQNLDSLAQRTRDVCWWPFTQHEQFKTNDDVTVIDSAHGDMFVSYRSLSSAFKAAPQSSLLSPLLDSSASWWTQCLGHSHPQTALAAAKAASRYGHVIFPGAANEPATRLSELLLGRDQAVSSAVAPWASRVFFSDDGSTGTEVAFKMAISSAEARYSTSAGQTGQSLPRRAISNAAPAAGAPKVERPSTSSYATAQTSVTGAPLTPAVLGLRGSYHGDTIGAMDASEPSVYNARVPWYTGKGAWLGAPVIRFKDGQATVEADLEHGHEDEWDLISEKLGSVPDAKAKLAWQMPYASLSDAYNVAARLQNDPLAEIYREHLRRLLRRISEEHAVVGPNGSGGFRFSALVLEPVILGAGGMRFVDPLFQRVLVDIVRDEGEEIFGMWDDIPALSKRGEGRRTPAISSSGDGSWRGLPIVFDEVFTGLYRLGFQSPSRSILGVNPDILVLAKILTGGLVPMSVTLASQSIFDTFTFAGSTKVDALLHGHSYTAHAVGCEVARETLHILGKMEQQGDWKHAQAGWTSTSPSSPNQTPEAGKAAAPIWSFWAAEAVESLSKSEKVRSAMALGTVLVIELVDENGGYASSAATDILKTLRTQPVRDIIGEDASDADFSIHARPLGNVLYFMSSLNSPAATLRRTESALLKLLA